MKANTPIYAIQLSFKKYLIGFSTKAEAKLFGAFLLGTSYGDACVETYFESDGDEYFGFDPESLTEEGYQFISLKNFRVTAKYPCHQHGYNKSKILEAIATSKDSEFIRDRNDELIAYDSQAIATETTETAIALTIQAELEVSEEQMLFLPVVMAFSHPDLLRLVIIIYASVKDAIELTFDNWLAERQESEEFLDFICDG